MPSLTISPALAHGTTPRTISSWSGGGYVIVPSRGPTWAVIDPSPSSTWCTNVNLSATERPDESVGGAGQSTSCGPSMHDIVTLVAARQPSATTMSAAAADPRTQPGT